MNKKEFFESMEGKSLFNNGIKNIELVLENCEIITIPIEDIGAICIKNFEKTFARWCVNDISMSEKCNYLILQIKDSSQTYKERLTISSTYEGDEKPMLERLKVDDITYIYINYFWDDEEYHWCVAWGGDSEYQNILQTTEEHLGDIWIAIGEEAQKELKDYYPQD